HPAHAALLGLQLRLPPASTLFPYTTLFRSLELLSTLNQWVKVRDASGDVLWVHRGDLAESRHVVASTLAAIRRTAQVNGELVVQVERGVLLEVVDASAPAGWLRVRHRDGATGFVSTGEVWGR